MSIQYTWEILSLNKKTVNGTNDVVLGVLWRKIGINQDGLIGESKKLTILALPETLNDNFIEYKDLTQQIIISWILSIEDEEQINLVIHQKIQEHIDNLVFISDGQFPWQIAQ